MKTSRTPILATLAALTCTATLAIAQSSAVVHNDSPFTGIWEGKVNELPGIDLKIDEAGGKISGVIVFYFQERADVNRPWRVTAEHPIPFLVARVDGRTLTFEVQHHKCHDCAELGPNVKFRVELTAPNELRLWKLDDQRMDESPSPGLKLTRRNEPAASALLQANSPFAGTWEGKLNDHPGIDLTISEAGGKVSGTVVFYVQERGEPASPLRVTGEDPVPLLTPRVEAKTLTFEVQPHTYQEGAEPGPKVKFRLDIAGPNELRLWKLDDQGMDESPGPGLRLTRRNEPAAGHDASQH